MNFSYLQSVSIFVFTCAPFLVSASGSGEGCTFLRAGVGLCQRGWERLGTLAGVLLQRGRGWLTDAWDAEYVPGCSKKSCGGKGSQQSGETGTKGEGKQERNRSPAGRHC